MRPQRRVDGPDLLRAACLAAVLAASACEDAPGASDTTARTPGDPPPSAVPMPALEPVMELGCSTCEGAELFGRIAAVSVGPGDVIAVLDQSAPHVRLFAPDGAALGWFGRSGAGPGELTRPVGLAISQDRVRIVEDRFAQSSRIHAFAPDGTHVESADAPLTVYHNAAVGASYRASPSGRWILLVEFVRTEGRSRVLRLDAASGALDTFAVPPELFDGVAEDTLPALRMAAAVSDEGRVALGYGDELYRLAVLSPDGRLQAVGGRDIARYAFTREEREQMLAARLRADSQLPEPLRDRLPRPSLSSMPTHQAHFGSDGLLFDARGRLWVRTTRFEESSQKLDVFGPDLAYLGEVDPGAYLTRWHIGPTFLVGSQIFSDLVPAVKVWRIRDP